MSTSLSIEAIPGAGEFPFAAELSRSRKGTLLIVDDEEGPRQSLRVIFKDEYEILLASDGPAAVELAQKHSIDVALLDIRMTGMSGIEVLERLKFVDQGIEVVMMTAYETTETIRQALRLRACDYINKPFDIMTVRNAVSQAMQRHTLESELDSNSEKLKQLLSELQKQKLDEQISQTRSDIYASIIHDINGPLTVISGFLQMINQRIGPAEQLNPEELAFVREKLKTITRQVTNCIEISRRYLGFLRGGSQDTALVSFNQLLRDLGQLVRVHPSLHHNQFSIQPGPDELGVRMNGTDVIQALLNLVVNAFQSTQEPVSVEVGATVLHEPLDLASFKDGPRNRFLNIEYFQNCHPLLAAYVRDTGPGIPEEVLPKIFQPYFTTKAPRQGTGLGLNIVQRLVKEAKGAMHVQTQPGQGTTFTLYLPASKLVSV
jgi:two-component system, sensor histidine kinase and response regulator